MVRRDERSIPLDRIMDPEITSSNGFRNRSLVLAARAYDEEDSSVEQRLTLEYKSRKLW